jgi:hypothetical protein
MGEFDSTPREKRPYVARNHRRTLHVELDTLKTEVHKLSVAVRSRDSVTGYVVRYFADVAHVHLAYGPVHGAYMSDVEKFLNDNGIDYQDLEEMYAEHAPDGCRHKKCAP